MHYDYIETKLNLCFTEDVCSRRVTNSPPGPPNPTPKAGTSKAGMIVGIVLGVVIAVCVCIGVGVMLYRVKKRKAEASYGHFH